MSGDSAPAGHAGTQRGKNIGERHHDQRKEPLTGIIELRTEGGPIELAIDEDAGLARRSNLERFLTQ
jgi:hypothetical protein